MDESPPKPACVVNIAAFLHGWRTVPDQVRISDNRGHITFGDLRELFELATNNLRKDV